VTPDDKSRFGIDWLPRRKQRCIYMNNTRSACVCVCGCIVSLSYGVSQPNDTTRRGWWKSGRREGVQNGRAEKSARVKCAVRIFHKYQKKFMPQVSGAKCARKIWFKVSWVELLNSMRACLFQCHKFAQLRMTKEPYALIQFPANRFTALWCELLEFFSSHTECLLMRYSNRSHFES